jgi:ribosomal peptide maturation radical SAM protein 1
MTNADPDSILFIVTPFLPEHQPALGVSSLLAVLRTKGIPASVLYLNLEYRNMIGPDLYFMISRAIPAELLLGEMIFTKALWPELASWDDYIRYFLPAYLEYARQIPRGLDREAAQRAQFDEWTEVSGRFRQLHDEAPVLVDEWAHRIIDRRPAVVAFTSTFQQNIATLALAKAIRARTGDSIALVAGGGNCEGDMGLALADNFPMLDHVHSGEAEESIIGIIEALRTERPAKRYSTGPSIRAMDSLPYPDFTDYFAQIQGSDLVEKANLVAETSRGCWWGAKSHCTFCGLNGLTMTYRSKSPSRAVDELVTLTEKYRRSNFLMADNIFDLSYLTTVFPALIERGKMIQMFFETKSNLRKDQLEVMAAAGVIDIQPGIESLSTPILRLMKKGTTRLQNLQLLKWAEEFRINVKWNFLYGFANEDPHEYAEMARLIPAVRHLPPPSGCARVRLDRFSPYWDSRGEYGIEGVHRFWSYDFAYPGLTEDQRDRLAYFFQYTTNDGANVSDYVAPCIDAVNEWLIAYQRGATLELTVEDGVPYVIDSRTSAVARKEAITDIQLSLLRALDQHHSAAKVVTDDESQAALSCFIDRGWVIGDKDQYLSVVIDRTERNRLVDRRVSIQMESIGLRADTFSREASLVSSQLVSGGS